MKKKLTPAQKKFFDKGAIKGKGKMPMKGGKPVAKAKPKKGAMAY